MSRRGAAWIAAVITGPSILFTPVASAAPNDQITNCSKPEFRQDHLAMCNRQPGPAFGVGGGGQGGGGLIGLIRDVVGGIL